MRRYAYLAALAIVALALWMWQGDTTRDGSPDSDRTATKPPDADEVPRGNPLTPAERAAYIAAVNRAMQERLVVHKGRVRLNAALYASLSSGVVYVPAPLVSVRCDKFFGIELRAPGDEGEDMIPAGIALVGWRGASKHELQERINRAPGGAEFMDEVCRMVVDELERLSAGQ